MSTAWVTARFVGFHSWPDAPDGRAYLRSVHRHVFHVKAEVGLVHDDRDVEFHDLVDQTNGIVAMLPGFPYLGSMSCEMIARHIATALAEIHDGRRVAVEVSEDGESGATVTVQPELPSSQPLRISTAD